MASIFPSPLISSSSFSFSKSISLKLSNISYMSSKASRREPNHNIQVSSKQHENVIATPHLGAITKEAQEGVAIEIAEAVVGALNGELSGTAVNAPMVAPEEDDAIEIAETVVGALNGELSATATKAHLVDSNTQVFDGIPLLSCSEAYEKMKAFKENMKGTQIYVAIYSSIFDGITTDPAAMVIPMDDHMVHRGHGVFDTAEIMDGSLYELDEHIDRFLKTASSSKINLPYDRECIKRILIQMVKASKCRNGSMRYWLSAGPGDFNISPSGCHRSEFYGSMKHPKFAIIKSVNYLPNVLSKMEAEEAGAFGIWCDDEGFVAEGPNMNVAFVTKEKEFIMPHFDKILSGCTTKRVLTLAETLIEHGKLRGVRAKNITVEEGNKAHEMMLLGTCVLVCPVVKWDEDVIGDGKVGDVTKELLILLIEDMKSSPGVRTPVPYEEEIFKNKVDSTEAVME